MWQKKKSKTTQNRIFTPSPWSTGNQNTRSHLSHDLAKFDQTAFLKSCTRQSEAILGLWLSSDGRDAMWRCWWMRRFIQRLNLIWGKKDTRCDISLKRVPEVFLILCFVHYQTEPPLSQRWLILIYKYLHQSHQLVCWSLEMLHNFSNISQWVKLWSSAIIFCRLSQIIDISFHCLSDAAPASRALSRGPWIHQS